MVLNKIMPGRNPDRGELKYEYYFALMGLVTRDMVRRPVMQKKYLTTAVECLQETLAIYENAPKGTKHRECAEYIKRDGLIAQCEMMRNSIPRN
jgi:hypothetical protein